MNLRIVWAMIIIVLVLAIPVTNGESENKITGPNENYVDFLNLFFPSSSDFTFHIFYKPGGAVHAWAGKQTNVTFHIEKINTTKHIGFYVRFIVTRGFWAPYRMPSSGSYDLIKKLQQYNNWINSTEALAHNLYVISPGSVYFKENMTSLTLNLRFTILGRGSDWGITVLARPENGTLWVPVSGIPVNVTGGNYTLSLLPYVYTGGTIVLLMTVAMLIKKRKLFVRKKVK